ncbi:hypothetical protein GOV12_06265 [Candidatus Pacearchaeota archaeon]|nr:hypothetical protein [Candidatus Pacearchaeota archaeon]
MKKHKKEASIDRFRNMFNKKSQVTVFIIIAIIIVVLIVLFFIFRGNIVRSDIPKEVEGVYSYYLSCIDYEAKNGALLLGQGAGYIDSPEFSPGSYYMPFSSHLGFLGNSIPYWFYVSGNGRLHENIPTIGDMEEELDEYVREGLSECDFSSFEDRGFKVILGDSIVSTTIRDNIVESKVNQNINIKIGKKSWQGQSHSVETRSNLGKFYFLSKKIYDNNKENMFLEKYGVDILRLYAPVDGSDISCLPKIWSLNDVRNDLVSALEANTPFIKIKGDYYDLKSEDNKYFVQDIGEDTPFNVNFMYSTDFPMKIEVWPDEDSDGVLRADPVGLQEGLGMLGFCYVPYHFVYDMYYPVLIQMYSEDEMFQFPLVVIIDKNQPRVSLGGTSGPNVLPELCTKMNTKITVNTFDTNLEPVESHIRFKCFDTACDIGDTVNDGVDASLTKEFPQCGNGYIIAISEGYETKKELATTINEGIFNIVLDKKYKLNAEVKSMGSEIDGRAIVSFVKENGTTYTLSYPEMKEIELTEGQYEIKTYVYSDSNINLKGSTTVKCVDVPKGAILGMFGVTEEKCFNMEIPDQTIDSAVSGGGTQVHYISESELRENNKIIIEPIIFGAPEKIEDIQVNYNAVDIAKLNIYFTND